MIIPNAHLTQFSDTQLLVQIPPAFRPGVKGILERCVAKHNGFCKLSVDTPSKPRTFGPGSQSAHLHGHLQQLAVHFGYTLGEMKDVMKDDVPEWPREERKIGKRRILRPVSEATVSTVVESKAIEWTHLIAAEEGLTLVEGEE
jgi:hypothetical protein